MERIIRMYSKDIDCVLHLGDCCYDAEIMSYIFPELRFEWIRGNCDDTAEPTERLLVLDNKKIFITHGHNYHVKSNYQRIIRAALKKGADACFFGHSHQPDMFYESGVLFMNPGSISLPRGTPLPSFGTVNISNNVVEGNVISIVAR